MPKVWVFQAIYAHKNIPRTTVGTFWTKVNALHFLPYFTFDSAWKFLCLFQNPLHISIVGSEMDSAHPTPYLDHFTHPHNQAGNSAHLLPTLPSCLYTHAMNHRRNM